MYNTIYEVLKDGVPTGKRFKSRLAGYRYIDQLPIDESIYELDVVGYENSVEEVSQ